MDKGEFLVIYLEYLVVFDNFFEKWGLFKVFMNQI